MAEREKTRYPGIFKTQHGTYEVIYRDPSQRQRTATFARLPEARDFQAETKLSIRRGDFIDPSASKTTFRKWAQKYLAQKLNIGRRTRDRYQESLDNHLLPAFGDAPLGSITPDEVQDWVAKMAQTEYAPGKTYSPETIRGHYALFAAMMKKAAARGVIGRSPCLDIELPKVIRNERRYLTERQVEALVQAMPARYRTLVIVGAYLGLRWQELAGLRRNAVILMEGQVPTLRVISTIERSNGRYEIKEYGKSYAARRTLKMPAWVAEALAWHMETFPHREWVFPAPEGGYLLYDNFRSRVWTIATKAAEIDPFDFHELRHTAAAFMVSEGGNALQVKRRMGHEDVRTTFNVYGHLFDDDEDALVQRLDRRARDAARGRDVGDLLGADESEGPDGSGESPENRL